MRGEIFLESPESLKEGDSITFIMKGGLTANGKAIKSMRVIGVIVDELEVIDNGRGLPKGGVPQVDAGGLRQPVAGGGVHQGGTHVGRGKGRSRRRRRRSQAGRGNGVYQGKGGGTNGGAG